jgi:cytidylate kinase
MSQQDVFKIALDGPAASGKSTVGLRVAGELGLRYFDTGLLYRALTWLALEHGIDVADQEGVRQLIDALELLPDELGRLWRGGEDLTPRLHRPEVDAAVSTVAAHPRVRSELVPVQRSLVRPPGLVMAGRDIGTVILPDAQLKIWLNASTEERARRRAQQTGDDYVEVLAEMRRRDHLDASRAVAPMARADDAVIVETDGVPSQQVIARIVELAQARSAQPHSHITSSA